MSSSSSLSLWSLVPLVACLRLSLDSFLVCLAMGAFVRPKDSRLRTAALFGLFDGLATLASGGGAAGAAIFVAFLLAMGGLAWLGRGWWRRLALPFAMCLDNLLTPRAPSEALAAGLASFAMAALGLAVAGLAVRSFSHPLGLLGAKKDIP
jgi:putative Mn2+ efflux pump MntP